MNIFINEMRMNRNSLLTWAITLPVLSFFFMVMYPALAKNMEAFIKVLENFPIEFRNAFGINESAFGTILGFYSFILTYVLIGGAVQAMNLGINGLSMEVRDKTSDFLYTKPVSRFNILASKISAVFVQVIITDIIFVLFSFFMLTSINSSMNNSPFDFKTFLLITGSLFMIQIIFACIGFAVSASLRRIRTVLPVSLGMVFFFYIIFVLNQTLKNASLSFLTPFGYFELSKIMTMNSYETKYVISMIVISIICVIFTGWSYSRKDFPAI